MRISSTGQVTIPPDIREKAGLLPNTDVDVTFDGEHVRIKRIEFGEHAGRGDALVAHIQGHGARLIAQLEGSGDVRMTTDEIMALTRGE